MFSSRTKLANKKENINLFLFLVLFLFFFFLLYFEIYKKDNEIIQLIYIFLLKYEDIPNN